MVWTDVACHGLSVSMVGAARFLVLAEPDCSQPNLGHRHPNPRRHCVCGAAGFAVSSTKNMNTEPDKPHAPNTALTSLFQSGRQRRCLGDLDR